MKRSSSPRPSARSAAAPGGVQTTGEVVQWLRHDKQVSHVNFHNIHHNTRFHTDR